MTTAAFHHIYERFVNRIRNFVAQKVSDPAYVDDLVQEIFIKVHNHIDDLNDAEKLDAWIFRIARNRVTDFYRTKRLHQSIPESDPVDEPGEFSEYDLVFDSDIRDWIEQLPDKYRQVLIKTELENRKYADVAAELGLSLPAVKSRVLRGREKLKEMLLECCHFEFDHYGGIADCIPKKQCSDCQL